MATNKSLSHVLCTFILLGIIISSAIFVTPVSAETITVTNTNDSGAGSLRQAIIDATPGSTVVFAPALSGGTITLIVEIEITIDLDIDGSSLASPITIDGDSGQIFIINSESTVTLDSLIIQGGNDVIHGGYGGGIYIYENGNLTVTNCTFSNNNAMLEGGAIYNGGTLTVTNSTFSENGSAQGGAIYNYRESSLSISNSTFSGNHGGEGGAIYNFLYSELIITDSTFVDNYADLGGGLFNYQLGIINVTSSTFSNNSADDGGGIYNYKWGANTTVSNSTFTGNSATIYGGGIFNGLDSELTVTNCTLVYNNANKGDGIYNNLSGTFNYINTIIANFSDGGDCVNDGTIGTNLKNFVGDHSCASTFYGDPMIGPLANNGGPTQTHALLEGSPALDVGDGGACPATDQRGVTRPQGTGCDIGAYEYQVDVYVFLPLILK